MANTPNFAATPVGFMARLSVANANRDGTTGTYAEVVGITATPTRIDDFTIQAIATTTAGMIRLFISNGTLTHLIREYTVTAVTASATVPAWEIEAVNQSIILPVGWSLKASTEKAESFNIVVTRAATF
jgi:hypothetical protein